MKQQSPTGKLKSLLQGASTGPLPDDVAAELREAVAESWSHLQGSDETSMDEFKVRTRAHSFRWEPPTLVFELERHGALTLGSTRAERQEWRINLNTAQTTSHVIGRRQVQKASERWDARSAAQQLAESIMAGRDDERIRWLPDGRVEVMMRRVLPSGPKRTTEGRRERLNAELMKILTKRGWRKEGRYWLAP
jgi:hypothetical protein